MNEDLADAIAHWADSSSNPDSLQRDDILRIKIKTVESFFASVRRPAAEVRTTDVATWRDRLKGQGLALATIRCRLSFLSSFYAWAMSDPDLGRHIRSNPVPPARPRGYQARQPESLKALSDGQIEALRAVIHSHASAGDLAALRDYALYLIFLNSGMRRAGVIGLKGKDLDLREDGVAITSRVRGGAYLRRLISSPPLKKAIMDYLMASGRQDVVGKDRPLWVRHDRGGQVTKKEQPLSAWAFVRRMKTYAEEARIGHFNLNRIRYTSARIMDQATGRLVETQDQSPATPLQQIAVKNDKAGMAIANRIKF